MNPEEVAKYDQSAAFIAENYPVMWWGIYKKLLEAGFNESQAMDLLKTYIVGFFSSIARRS